MRKVGDVSRRRRLLGGEARTRWYARHRAERFARRFAVLPGFFPSRAIPGSVPVTG